MLTVFRFSLFQVSAISSSAFSRERRMGRTREYVALMKFRNACYRVDVMDAGALTGRRDEDERRDS